MPATANGSERREHPRYDVPFDVRCKPIDLKVHVNDADAASLEGGDLSLGGIRATAAPASLGPLTLAPGQKVLLEIKLEENKPAVLAAARVMWAKGDDLERSAGLKFVIISEDGLERIRTHVSRSAMHLDR